MLELDRNDICMLSHLERTAGSAVLLTVAAHGILLKLLMVSLPRSSGSDRSFLGLQVYIAPIDKDHLLRELDSVTSLDEPGENFATVMPAIAKVLVCLACTAAVQAVSPFALFSHSPAAGWGIWLARVGEAVFGPRVHRSLSSR